MLNHDVTPVELTIRIGRDAANRMDSICAALMALPDQRLAVTFPVARSTVASVLARSRKRTFTKPSRF